MVVRIAGINLNNDKRIDIAITYIYGVGRPTATQVLTKLGIDPATKVKDLPTDQESKLRIAIEKDMVVEGDLRREVSMDIKRLKDIGSYRGSRHTKKLPLRGQRTKTNARTKRGKKVTMGSGRKKSSDKT